MTFIRTMANELMKTVNVVDSSLSPPPKPINHTHTGAKNIT